MSQAQQKEAKIKKGKRRNVVSDQTYFWLNKLNKWINDFELNDEISP